MSYFYLALAIAAEVAGTSLLKATEEFTKLVPTTFLIIFYAMSFWLMTLALRDLPLGVVYAVWSGLGIVLVAIIGALVYKEMPDLGSIIGMALIILFRCFKPIRSALYRTTTQGKKLSAMSSLFG